MSSLFNNILQLSVYKGADGIQALVTSNARKLAELDESMLLASGIPYTIIRAGSLQNTPGGTQGFSFQEVCIVALSTHFYAQKISQLSSLRREELVDLLTGKCSQGNSS